jgi:hypothetical protein
MRVKLEELKKLKRVEAVQEKLKGLDMTLEKTFTLSKELCADPQALAKKGPLMATAKSGALSFRVRTSYAYEALAAAFQALPEEGRLGRGAIGARVKDTYYVDGGAENALGRLALAYPKVGATLARPVRKAEAYRALDGAGLNMARLGRDELRPFPLLPFRDGEGAVKVNPNSDNGYPVLSKWSDPEAAKRSMGLAVSFRNKLRPLAYGEAGFVGAGSKEGGRVWEHIRGLERTDPQYVAVRGKAKADYYRSEKVLEGKLRFYNALPRHIALNMQVATQPLEQRARHILQDSKSCSGIGLTLHHGGAGDLVAELDRRLLWESQAFVHVGDDSWVILSDRRLDDGRPTPGSHITMFALDCSNFDLTQHADATREIHGAIHAQLSRIDYAAAELWYAYARERVVVVSGAVTRRFKHAGPSGMPLQSKVNDMLMHVLIERILDEAPEGLGEEELDRRIQRIGRDMGLAVRVEQYARINAASLFEALERCPFLFVGYEFFVRGGEVRVCADWARQMAQLPYPGLKWMKTEQELQVKEAMRLGSIVLSMGMPLPELDASFAALRAKVMALLERTIQAFGDKADERLRWAVQDSPLGPTTVPSLSGLLAALRRDPRELWVVKETELPSTSVLVGVSWADEVEEEERAAGTVVPGGISVPGVPLRLSGRETTHPATMRNDGRPAPTAVWGPNKQPRLLRVDRGIMRRVGAVLQEEEYLETSSVFYESEFSYTDGSTFAPNARDEYEVLEDYNQLEDFNYDDEGYETA